MASGLVAGCWVFLADTMPFAKYTNKEKSKGEVATYPSWLPPSRFCTPTICSSYPSENIQIATLSQCERRLLPNPFDRIQWASIFKFIWRRFLFLQPFLARPSPVLLSSLSFSVSLSFSSTFAFFPATKTVTRNRCELPGVSKGTRKKEFASCSFFFLLRSSILAVWIWNGNHADRCVLPHVVTVRRRYFGRRGSISFAGRSRISRSRKETVSCYKVLRCEQKF